MSKSIPTSRNQEEGEDSSDENYRPENEVLNPYPSQTDGYDSEYESTVDSVINYNINECDFSKISYAETESDLKNPANAEFAKIIKKNWESKKTNDNMKSIFKKHKSPENWVFVPPKVNLEVWKLLSSWQRKSDIKFMSIQKSLVWALNASLSILSEQWWFHCAKYCSENNRKCCHIGCLAWHELSLRWKVLIRNVIKSE